MKTWWKIALTVALAASMTLAAGAVETENPVSLPNLVKAHRIAATSSLSSDGSDPAVLYDADAATGIAFADATEGVSLSMTTKKAFWLHSIVVNATDTAYKASLYASNDGENWVEICYEAKEKDGFVVYEAKHVGRAYKFYRLSAQTEEGGLTFHTLAMYEKDDDAWPHALWRGLGWAGQPNFGNH